MTLSKTFIQSCPAVQVGRSRSSICPPVLRRSPPRTRTLSPQPSPARGTGKVLLYLANDLGISPSDILHLTGIPPERTLRSNSSAVSWNTGVNGTSPPAGFNFLVAKDCLGHHAPNSPNRRCLSFALSDTLGWGLHGRKAILQTSLPVQTGKTMLRTHIAVSPRLRCIANFTRTFIDAGSAENLVDQIRTLERRMAADMGEGYGVGRVTYYEASDDVRVYPGFKFYEPERSEDRVMDK